MSFGPSAAEEEAETKSTQPSERKDTSQAAEATVAGEALENRESRENEWYAAYNADDKAKGRKNGLFSISV